MKLHSGGTNFLYLQNWTGTLVNFFLFAVGKSNLGVSSLSQAPSFRCVCWFLFLQCALSEGCRKGKGKKHVGRRAWLTELWSLRSCGWDQGSLAGWGVIWKGASRAVPDFCRNVTFLRNASILTNGILGSEALPGKCLTCHTHELSVSLFIPIFYFHQTRHVYSAAGLLCFISKEASCMLFLCN